MNKIFSIIAAVVVVLGVFSNAHAQGRSLRFNVGAGLALPKVSASSSDASVSVSMNESPFVYAGLDYSLRSNSQVHLEGGLQWMLLGFKDADDSESYFSVPLSLRYQFSEALPLSVGAGVYAGSTFVEGSEIDFGLLLKVRYDLAKRFYAVVQYNLGLKDHSAIDKVSAKLNTLQFGAGIIF